MGLIRLIAAFLVTIFVSSGSYAESRLENEKVVIALLHFSPLTGELKKNTRKVSSAMKLAKEHGADWFVTPELSLTGYYFNDVIGTEWLKEHNDPFKAAIVLRAKSLKLHTFLSHIEYADNKYFNTIFFVNQQGEVAARHRKINVIPGSEDWSTAGYSPTVAKLDEYSIGLLICADAWPSRHAAELKKAGVDIVISPANWGPGKYGPGSTWADRSKELGVPLIVNNRTGIDRTLDLRKARSVVAEHGEHSFEFHSEKGALILLEFVKREGALQFADVRKIIYF